MDDKQAKRLGTFLRRRRHSLRLSTHQLAETADMPHSTIIRFEQGAFSAPAPDKLARISEALGLSLADVYALADYAVPGDLPSPTLYLRTKYRDLPKGELAAMTRDIERVLKSRGIDPSAGPQPGEDEKDIRRKKPTSRRPKGGKK